MLDVTNFLTKFTQRSSLYFFCVLVSLLIFSYTPLSSGNGPYYNSRMRGQQKKETVGSVTPLEENRKKILHKLEHLKKLDYAELQEYIDYWLRSLDPNNYENPESKIKINQSYEILYPLLMNFIIKDIIQTHNHKDYSTIKNSFDALFYFLSHTEKVSIEITEKVPKHSLKSNVTDSDDEEESIKKQFQQRSSYHPHELVEITKKEEREMPNYPFRFPIIIGLFEAFKVLHCPLEALTSDDRRKIIQGIKNTFQDIIEECSHLDIDTEIMQTVIQALDQYIKKSYKKETYDAERELKKKQQYNEALNENLKKVMVLGTLAGTFCLIGALIWNNHRCTVIDNDNGVAEDESMTHSLREINNRQRRIKDKRPDTIQSMVEILPHLLTLMNSFVKTGKVKSSQLSRNQQLNRPGPYHQSHVIRRNMWDSDDDSD